MAFSTRSVHKSQHRLQCPASGASHLVLRRQYLQGVEIDPIFLVGPWQTYVPMTLRNYDIHDFRVFRSWLGQEHPLVCEVTFFLYRVIENINQLCDN